MRAVAGDRSASSPVCQNICVGAAAGGSASLQATVPYPFQKGALAMASNLGCAQVGQPGGSFGAHDAPVAGGSVNSALFLGKYGQQGRRAAHQWGACGPAISNAPCMCTMPQCTSLPFKSASLSTQHSNSSNVGGGSLGVSMVMLLKECSCLPCVRASTSCGRHFAPRMSEIAPCMHLYMKGATIHSKRDIQANPDWGVGLSASVSALSPLLC